MTSNWLIGACATCAWATGAEAQELLRRGVERIVGATPHAVWTESASRIGYSDGTPGGSFDLGIASAPVALFGDRMLVYQPTRVYELLEDGSSRVAPVPAPYDGFDAGSLRPRVWTLVVQSGGLGGDSYSIEIWTRTMSGWMSTRRDVGSTTSVLFSDAIPRPASVLLTGTDIDSQFVLDFAVEESGAPGGWTRPPNLVDLGQAPATAQPWSGGVAFLGRFLALPVDSVFFADDGRRGRIGCGDECHPEYVVREPSPGVPIAIGAGAATQGSLAFFPFLVDQNAYPVPGQALVDLEWLPGSDRFLALVQAGGANEAWFIRRAPFAQQRAPALDGYRRTDLLGEIRGSAWLLAERMDASRDLFRFDRGTGSLSLVDARVDVRVGEFAHVNGSAVVVRDDGVRGAEPWFLAPGGFVRAIDVLPGAASSSPRGLTTIGERAVFVADDGHGPGLFALDLVDLDWVRSPFGDRYYRLTPPLPWHEAREEARRMGGELATVRDPADQNFLWSTFGGRDLWIGLQDLDRDGSFTWVSGDPSSYRNWCTGEPNGAASDELVVHLANYPGFCVGGWNDQSPTDRYPGIVERQSRPVAVESFGDGCRLGVVSLSDPRAAASLRFVGGHAMPGGTLEFELDSGIVDPGTCGDPIGAVLVGADNAVAHGSALPIDLALLGLPHCELQVRIDETVPLLLTPDPPAFGFFRSTWRLRIPADPSVVGARAFVQGLVVAPCLVGGGHGYAATTEAWRVVVGR